MEMPSKRTGIPMLFEAQKGNVRRKRIGLKSRFDQLCAFLLVLVLVYFIVSFRSVVDIIEPINNSRSSSSHSSSIVTLEPPGPLFHPTQTKQTNSPKRALVIAAAPRSTKHLVALWSSLECFTADVDHVAISAPTWSRPILEKFLQGARDKFASKFSIEGMLTVNDRYDVGLWCDALEKMGIPNKNNNAKIKYKMRQSFDEIALLNDSVFALGEYAQVFSALKEHNASMVSLNYSTIHPKGTGEEYYWLESVWRAFDEEGIRTFVDYSCRAASDPLFCPHAWWGKKGCIVENFERRMAWQFPRDKVYGLFASDVPKELITRQHSFPSWVRHVPYWKQLVEEQDFPISKVNWEGMVDSIDDERLNKCTNHLDRSWLEEFDFSASKSAI